MNQTICDNIKKVFDDFVSSIAQKYGDMDIVVKQGKTAGQNYTYYTIQVRKFLRIRLDFDTETGLLIDAAAELTQPRHNEDDPAWFVHPESRLPSSSDEAIYYNKFALNALIL